MPTGRRRRRLLDAPFALSLLSPAATTGLSFAINSHGAALWGVRGGLIVAGLLAPIAVQIEKRHSQAAEHLAVDVVAMETSIARFPSDRQAVDEWLAAEQVACLPAQKVHVDEEVVGDLSIADIRALESRQTEGVKLSPLQQKQVLAANQMMHETMRNLAAAADLFSSPDRRTRAQYEDEVRTHLDACRTALEATVVRGFVTQGYGRLHLKVVNPTDRPRADVVVELFLPDGVDVITVPPSKVETELPARPRPLGERVPIATGGPLWTGPSMITALGSTNNSAPSVPIIETVTGETKVTFPAVDLRAEGEKPLTELHLLAITSAGDPIEMRWEATAQDASGRVPGALQLHLTSAPTFTLPPQKPERLRGRT